MLRIIPRSLFIQIHRKMNLDFSLLARSEFRLVDQIFVFKNFSVLNQIGYMLRSLFGAVFLIQFRQGSRLASRIFSKIILLLFITSCGFQVIYKDQQNSVELAGELAAIRIKKDRDHLSQELKNNLYDLLNPDSITLEPKYFLTLKTTTSTSATFITSTGAAGRNKVILDVVYELKNLESGELIAQGSTSVNDNYDISTNRYGNIVADEYVQTNLTKVAAQNIRNSLVNDIIEMKKKCDVETQCNKVAKK